MEKESYHHGALREDLIQKGIQLINEEGFQKFSLRKVAALCQVSHTAPYKHFKNKEELMEAIGAYVLLDFSEAIRKAAEENPGQGCLLAIGTRYVTYMTEHKDYFNFLFSGPNKAVVLYEEGKFSYQEGHPFGVFKEVATKILQKYIPEENPRNQMILQCWCEVHGLAHLIISGILECKEGYDQIARQMLYIQMNRFGEDRPL